MDEPETGKPKNLEKTCSSDLSLTIEPSWTGLKLNLEIQNNRALTDWMTEWLIVVIVVVVIIIVIVIIIVVIGGGGGGGGDNDDNEEEEEEEEEEDVGGAVCEKFNETVCELDSVTLQLSNFVCSCHCSCTLCCIM